MTAVPWEDPAIRTWAAVKAAGYTRGTWTGLCPREQFKAIWRTSRGRPLDLRTERGLDSELFRRQMDGLRRKWVGVLGEAAGGRLAQAYEAEFRDIYMRYEAQVRRNRVAGWGYGWVFDIGAARVLNPTEPTPNDGARPQGICNEWAGDIETAVAGSYRYWSTGIVGRRVGSSHYGVRVWPKTTVERDSGTTDPTFILEDSGFIFDAWKEGKADLYDPKEWHVGSTAAATYAEIMDPVAAFKFYTGL